LSSLLIDVVSRQASATACSDKQQVPGNEGHFISTYLAPDGYKRYAEANPVIAKFFNEPEPKPDYKVW